MFDQEFIWTLQRHYAHSATLRLKTIDFDFLNAHCRVFEQIALRVCICVCVCVCVCVCAGGMRPDPALKHHFRLRLNREWAWWICVWVIVLSFTLGRLLGDNPLLGETRPNTTSLISLPRPCCFVAIKSHAQLSAAALSPWRHWAPPSLMTIYTVPWLTCVRAVVIALGICDREPSEPRLCPRTRVPWKSRGWPRSEHKASQGSARLCRLLSPHSRSSSWGSARQYRWI